MIKSLKFFFSRLKYGYEIADGLFLTSPSKNEFVVTDKEKQKLKIYFERLEGKPDRILYKSDEIKFLPPYDKVSISDQHYQSIIDAIIKHFESLGEVVESR